MAAQGKTSRNNSSTTRNGNSSKKNNSTAKNTNKNNNSGRSNSGRNKKTIDPRKNEIKMFINLGISAFLLCSLFGWCGVVGDFFAKILFGLFGIVAYIMPIYYFFSSAFLLANGALKQIVKRVWCFGLFIVSGAFVCQMIYGTKGLNFKSLYEIGYKEKRGSGAILGGLLVFLNNSIGMTGSIIVSVVLFIIGIIIVMDVSIIDSLKNKIDEYSYYEDEDDEDIRPKRVKDKNLMKNIEVLDESKESDLHNNKEKKTKNKVKNRVVKSQEVHELKPLKPEDPLSILTNKVESKDFFDNDSETYQFADAENDISIDLNRINEKNNISGTRSIPLGNTLDAGDFAKSKNDSDLKDNELVKKNTENKLRNDKQSNYTDDLDMSYEYEDAKVGDAAETGRKRKKTKESMQEMADATKEVEKIISSDTKSAEEYKFPPLNLLKSSNGKNAKNNDSVVRDTAIKLKSTLENFGVKVSITDYSQGPAVTRYELQPEQGVKVSKILSLTDDIKLNLAASDIRIEAPIPGKAAIGIEVPNKESQPVYFGDLLKSEAYKNFKQNLAFAVGKDISGDVIVADIAKMPHLLVAGATGSGKSVCINSLIMSILYKAKPSDVKMIMIDPKQVELSVYNGIPHMLIPVVTDPKKAAGALNWAVMEMTKRYNLFKQYNVRNIQGYNQKVKQVTGKEEGNEELQKLPQIVIIVDELADLMMVAHGEVEDAIVRLSQLARAAGLHLVIATQRPSVDVITGLIKANVPSRIAMTVSSGVDSRTIIDMVGAEKLLGKGDMLFYPTGYPKPVRVQGAFLSDEEISDVCDFLKEQSGEVSYDENISKEIDNAKSVGTSSGQSDESDYDDYFVDAGKFIIGKDKASIGMLQRVFKIGFNRAARIMDQLSEAGVVGPEEGTKPRKVLMSEEEFENFVEANL